MVRHAHSAFNLEEEETRGLSIQGMEDADRVKELLLKENIDAVYSSSYTRAIQTVQGLADSLNKEVKVDERFRERDLAAKDYRMEDTKKAMQEVFENPDFRLPGGETNNEVKERGAAALKDVLKKHEGQRVAIGIHGHIMAITMGAWNEKYGTLNFWRRTTKPDIYRLEFKGDELCDVTRLWEAPVLGGSV
jgi:2,3-bisphosphoglycerate-dependent phosphoglycerate mutase